MEVNWREVPGRKQDELSAFMCRNWLGTVMKILRMVLKKRLCLATNFSSADIRMTWHRGTYPASLQQRWAFLLQILWSDETTCHITGHVSYYRPRIILQATCHITGHVSYYRPRVILQATYHITGHVSYYRPRVTLQAMCHITGHVTLQAMCHYRPYVT